MGSMRLSKRGFGFGCDDEVRHAFLRGSIGTYTCNISDASSGILFLDEGLDCSF